VRGRSFKVMVFASQPQCFGTPGDRRESHEHARQDQATT